MNRNVFTQYSKKRILEAKQTHTHVSDPPKKPTTRDKTKPLSFQKVRPKSKQLGVTWFGHLVVLSRTRKC